MTTVVVANAHSGGSSRELDFATWLAHQARGPLVALLSEAHQMHDELDERAGDVWTGAGSIGAREVAIVTRGLFAGSDPLAHTIPLTEDCGTGVAPARCAQRLIARVEGRRTAVYSLHANAAIQVQTGIRHSCGGRQWAKALDKLEDLWRADLDAGLALLVGGDLNWRRTTPHRPGSPDLLFNRLGLRRATSELMWVGWSHHFKGSGVDVLPHPPGSDHVALRLTLTSTEPEAPVTTYMPRSAWTDTAPGGAVLTGGNLQGVAIHYPAAGDVTLANLNEAEVIRRLQGWRSFHVNDRGWSDIGYQVAIDGSGRVWDLRGITRVPAAHASDANPDANEEFGACLFIVGNNEKPTAAQVQAFRDWRRDKWLAKWPGTTVVTGHTRVPGAQTACPGSQILALVDSGAFTSTDHQEEDMPTPAEYAAAVWAHKLDVVDSTDTEISAGRMLGQVHKRAGGIAALSSELAVKLNLAQDVVEAAVREVFADLSD